MDYERKRLVADGDRILTEDGEYISTVSMTRKAKALLDNEGWKKGNESWIDYRNRTAQARENEEKKRIKFVEEIVAAYNYSIDLYT
jgi:hypothetical protein